MSLLINFKSFKADLCLSFNLWLTLLRHQEIAAESLCRIKPGSCSPEASGCGQLLDARLVVLVGVLRVNQLTS
jgi:hypothetical protein